MKKELHRIVGFFKKSDNKLIGYLMGNFDLIDDINQAHLFSIVTDLSPLADLVLKHVYENGLNGTINRVSKNEYGHLWVKWFKDIDKDDVFYKFIVYEQELRNKKIDKIKIKKRKK